MGDSTDGIPGINGMGPKKTDKFLEGIPEDKLDEAIRKLYKENNHSEEYCNQMLAMVYMLQNWDEYYEYYPAQKPEEEPNNEQEDAPSLQAETDISQPDVLQSEEQDEGVSGVSGGDTDAPHDGQQG
jgi:5'-3' exonuclease